MKKPLVIKKNVKHTFTPEEIAGLNTEFRQSFANLKSVEAEFDSVKASYKAKTTEAESRMETLNATLQAGFEMRQKDCVVIFRPADRKKDFYLPDAFDDNNPGIPKPDAAPVAVEDMTQDDFEQDLIQVEGEFEHRVELPLWDAGSDKGKLVVGFLRGRWFAAVRGNVGALKLEERLNSEQPATKKRIDAIVRAEKRVNEWLKTNLGKDTAKGFADAIEKVVEGEREKVE